MSGTQGDDDLVARLVDTFADVGPPPSNEVVADPDADEAPNIDEECGDGVPDD